MRGADILVEMLINYGVDTVFGVPGDTNVPFYEALQARMEMLNIHFHGLRVVAFRVDGDEYGGYLFSLVAQNFHGVGN